MNYVYIRFSTDKQDESQQINTVENFLKGKGISIDEVVKDEGVSGGVSYKKRNLYRLVQKMGPGDTLIVTEASRLGRSMADLNRLVNDELRPRGVRLIIINMGFDVDCSQIKAMDEILLSFFGFAAQIEKEMIQERTRNGLEARKKRGEAIGGTKELWGKNTPGADRDAQLADDRAKMVERKRERARNKRENVEFQFFIRDWQLIHGKLGWQADWKAVSDELNIRGLKTSTGMAFNPTRARSMYQNIVKLYGEA